MSLLNNILGVSAYWQVNKDLAKKTSINCALLLSDLISKYAYFEDKDMLVEFRGDYYFFATAESIEEDTTFSYKVQKRTIEELKRHGLIKTKLMSTPAKLHFTICEDKILLLLQTSSSQKSILDKPKSKNLYINKNKENKNKQTRINNNVENFQFSDSEINSELEEKKKCKEKSSAKKESDGLHGKMIQGYHEWYSNRNDGVPPKIDAQSGKAMKELIAYFKTVARSKYQGINENEIDEKVLEMFSYILSQWNNLDSFTQRQIKLSQINSNISNIIEFIKNGKNQRNNNNQTNQLSAIERAKEAMAIVRERDRIRNGYSTTE